MKKSLTMKEIQEVSLMVLKKITDLCERHGFRYFLAYGTLIGAIRHKGYIPWDDDVDIMMPRPDYERFLSYFAEHKDELEFLQIFTPETCKTYPYVLARVSDSRYTINVKNERNCELGVFIDVYPLDGIGHSEAEALSHLKKTTKYPSLIFLATRIYYHFGITKGWKKRLLKIPAFVYTHIMGKKYFMSKLYDLLKLYKYEDCEYVGAAAWCTQPRKNVYKKEWCEDLIKAPFECYDFYIPRHYDEMLKVTYGNYMELPPEKDRIYHHMYKAYKKD